MSSTSPDPFTQAESRLSWPALLLAGGIAGIGKSSPFIIDPPKSLTYHIAFTSAGWVATFPLDVVKTRMQSSSTTLGTSSPVVPSTVVDVSPNALPTTPLLNQESLASSRIVNPYRTILSTVVHSYQTEGFQVFFRGLSPTLIRLDQHFLNEQSLSYQILTHFFFL